MTQIRVRTMCDLTIKPYQWLNAKCDVCGVTYQVRHYGKECPSSHVGVDSLQYMIDVNGKDSIEGILLTAISDISDKIDSYTVYVDHDMKDGNEMRLYVKYNAPVLPTVVLKNAI